MQIKKATALKRLHTFGLPAKCKAFISVKSISELRQALKLPYASKMILGGGSNLVFLKDYDGLVIKNDLKGIKVVRKFKHCVHVSCMGGEDWHDMVMWSVNKKYGGLQNLSLIPGTVGAAPIQNIGAYGVELKDVFVKLKAIEVKTGKEKTFWKKECQFAYRNSYFKNKGKGKFVITEVTFKLSKKPHKLNISYGRIQSSFLALPKKQQTIKGLSDVVVKIRRSKLPDPAKIGNCGSFFKNPIVPKSTLKRLQELYPTIPHYPADCAKAKLAAGWLIDQCGWKGKRVGNVGCFKNQALVIVNHGGAKAVELERLVKKIKASVKQKFDIQLEEEVNLIK